MWAGRNLTACVPRFSSAATDPPRSLLRATKKSIPPPIFSAMLTRSTFPRPNCPNANLSTFALATRTRQLPSQFGDLASALIEQVAATLHATVEARGRCRRRRAVAEAEVAGDLRRRSLFDDPLPAGLPRRRLEFVCMMTSAGPRSAGDTRFPERVEIGGGRDIGQSGRASATRRQAAQPVAALVDGDRSQPAAEGTGAPMFKVLGNRSNSCSSTSCTTSSASCEESPTRLRPVEERAACKVA